MYTICSGNFLEGCIPVKSIYLGAGAHYCIFKDEKPYLKVETPFCSWNPFNTACIFQKMLCIGAGDRVFFIELETWEIKEYSLELYFGSFYVQENRIYVASGTQILCFDEQCRQVWETGHIAVDGVVIEEVREEMLIASCEMDPPGGWVRRQICVRDGITAW